MAETKTQIPSGINQDCPHGYQLDQESGICFPEKTQVDFEGVEVHGEIVKPSVSFIQEYQGPQFVCDEYLETGDVEKWKDCMKQTYGLSNAGQVSLDIAKEFAETRQCPQNFEDIDLLKKISKHYRKNPFEVSVAELVAIPIDANSPELESHLPISCGYNSPLNTWFESLNLYCEGESQCFSQSSRAGPKNNVEFIPLTDATNLWEVIHTKDGDKSYREGGYLGDSQLIPLGNGVYVQTLSVQKKPYYYGLVLVPQADSDLEKACEKERWLEANDSFLTDSEKEEVQREIHQLMLIPKALKELKEITRYLHENQEHLPEVAKERLQNQAKELAKIVNGEKVPEITGSACEAFTLF